MHVTSSAAAQQPTRVESAGLLVDHTARLLAQLEQAETDLVAHDGAVAGRLTLAAFATAARGLWPTALQPARPQGEEPDAG
jgi:DNA-binding transcriptional LysR family regulator